MSEAIRIISGSFGRVALLDMNGPLVRHAHPHCHVLIKIGGSDTRFMVADRQVPLTDDHAVLIDPWKPHAYLHEKSQPATTLLALYIQPHWLGRFRTNWGNCAEFEFFSQPCGLISPPIRRLADALANAMIHAFREREECKRILGALMVAVIERFTDWQSAGTGLGDAPARKMVDWRVRKAIETIRAQPGAVIRVEDLAEIGGMSRANFFRRFEASTGVTPLIFQNVFRIEEALHATAYSDESFGTLSERLGFTSQAHFTRFFRNHAAITPSHLRAVFRLGTD